MKKLGFIVAASFFISAAWAQDALKLSGVEHGLCVVVPAKNGDELAELTHAGSILVQGIVYDDNTLVKIRSTIESRGLNGLATVAKPLSNERLPYADNLINLLICDNDDPAAKKISNDEMLRVIAPNGVLLMKSGGEWKRTIKPYPKEMDSWTHFDHDSAGTGVSHDKLAKPPTSVQWRMELEPYTGLGGNPAGYRPYTSFRLANGRAFFGLKLGNEDDKSKNANVFTVGRDAFNGLPLWKIPTTNPGNGTPQEFQFAINDSRVFTFLEPGTFPVALDANTGKVMTTFEKGAKSPNRTKINPGYYMLRATNDVLLECAEDKLFIFDANSGEVKWMHQEKDAAICFPRILEKEKRVLVQIVEPNLDRIQGRWANLKTFALLCLSLETGKEIWRSTEIKDMNFGQAIAADDCIYLFNPGGIGASESWGKNPGGIVAKLSASDGKLLWKSSNFVWGYNLLVRDGKPFFADPNSLNTLAPSDGTISAFWKAPFNNRCNRTSATDDWIIMGIGNYVNRDGNAIIKGITRSGCAQGVMIGNGLLYFAPNTCHCITQLRGHLALSADALPAAAVPDNLRLDKSGAFATAANAKPTELSGPISSEWLPQIWYGAPETVPVKDGDHEIVSVIHEHRIECHKAGKALWSFTAGGRVSQPPILDNGLCFFGGHDGYLYCLDAADGKLQWRFFAAPYERNFVSHGQVESSWPVYNAVMHAGKVCCSAGLHSETGGGIFVWGLEPKTGAIAWRKNLKRSELLVKPGEKIAPNRVMNSPLQSDGNTLSITGISFAADEPEAEINKRIDTGSLGDKNRNWSWSLRGPMIKTDRK